MLAKLALVCLVCACDSSSGTSRDAAPPIDTSAPDTPPDPAMASATRMIAEGRQTFRYDTFGDEAFWGDTLRLHGAVATLSPKAALGLGLKVDRDALPAEVIAAL